MTHNAAGYGDTTVRLPKSFIRRSALDRPSSTDDQVDDEDQKKQPAQTPAHRRTTIIEATPATEDQQKNQDQQDDIHRAPSQMASSDHPLLFTRMVHATI